MGGKKKSTIGYRYNAPAHFVLGVGPWDSINKIKYGDKVCWEGATTGGQITIAAPDLYGGETGEGGITGDVDVMMGAPTQPRNSFLLGVLGATVSAYRGVVSLVFRNTYWGNAPYFKAVKVEGTRIHLDENGATQWYDAKAEITQPSGYKDMNPMHIVRECIVSTDGGLGRPASMIDDANFRAVADTLHAEGFGLSIVWAGETSAMEFAQDVLGVIDARMYIHPRTKLYTIKLIRDDYNVDDLPTLGPRQIRRVDDYKRPEPVDLPNSIAVTFWNSDEGSDSTLTADDPAAIINSGAIKSISRDYTDSVTSATLAARIAQRDGRAAGAPLLSATLTCTSAAADLLPGDPFIFDWPLYHDNPIVCRVVKTKRGGLIKQSVVLEVVEDVFTLDDSAIVPGGSSGWVDPVTVALPAATPFAVEAPYYELLQRFGQTRVADFTATTPDAGMVLATAARVAASVNAIAYSDSDIWANNADLSPTGTLQTALSISGVIADIAWAYFPAVGSHIQIDGEMMRVDGFDGGERTIVGRGVLDTVPTAHSVAAVGWAWDAFATSDEVEHAAGETVGIRLQLRNNSRVGALSLSVPVSFAARAIRPYPPGKLQFNGLSYPASLPYDADVVLTWAARNRLTQADQLIDTTAGTITAEVGTTYTVRVFSPIGLERTYSGITTLTQTYSQAHELADGGPFASLRFEVESVRDGYVSMQHHNVTISRPAPTYTGQLGTPNSIPSFIVLGAI